MKEVFAYIARRTAEHEKLPLFQRLRDGRLDPAERLKFVPWAAHFVLTVADLFRFVLPASEPRDACEELVDRNLAEEASHLSWYLNDIAKMDFDPMMRFTDALRLVWGADTIKTRQLSYEICRLSAGVTPVEKLTLVTAMEATGRTTFEAMVPAGVELEQRLGRRLAYFGAHHLDTELQHTLEDGEVHRTLANIALSDEARKRHHALVDRVFELFAGFADDSYRIATGPLSLAPTRAVVPPPQ